MMKWSYINNDSNPDVSRILRRTNWDTLNIDLATRKDSCKTIQNSWTVLQSSR